MNTPVQEPNADVPARPPHVRPSMWRTVVATAAIVVAGPWLAAIGWGKGQPDTIVALLLFLNTPLLFVVGVALGFAMYGLRVVRYNADKLAAGATGDSSAGEAAG